MAKRVYFCFHHQDLVDWRVQVVRNLWLSSEGHEDAGLFDEPTWDESSMSGQAAVRRLIDGGLEHTGITCVLLARTPGTGAGCATRSSRAYSAATAWSPCT